MKLFFFVCVKTIKLYVTSSQLIRISCGQPIVKYKNVSELRSIREGFFKAARVRVQHLQSINIKPVGTPSAFFLCVYSTAKNNAAFHMMSGLESIGISRASRSCFFI